MVLGLHSTCTSSPFTGTRNGNHKCNLTIIGLWEQWTAMKMATNLFHY